MVPIDQITPQLKVSKNYKLLTKCKYKVARSCATTINVNLPLSSIELL